eukprot:TRINITY_DN40484_c0_g2_i1.p1 TRINITY_DN40484_c0_g2~~TRINITY_DN40484_c0_g2_i1.p1  ORF type:complete len:171 (+),score=20.17 TRINITY_DN40484_c0_g2_i1:3-515(+)
MKERAERIQKAVLDSVPTDLRWSFELSQCEFLQLDLEDTKGEKPRGLVKIGELKNQKEAASRVSELESQIMTSKMALAQTELDKEELYSQIRELQLKLQRAAEDGESLKAKAKADRDLLEKTLHALAESEQKDKGLPPTPSATSASGAPTAKDQMKKGLDKIAGFFKKKT